MAAPLKQLADLIVLQVGYQHCVRMNGARCGLVSRDQFMEFNRERWRGGVKNIPAYSGPIVDALIWRLQPGRLALPEGYSL